MKKAQAWGFDLTIASFIFLMAIVSFYLYTLNYSSQEDIFPTLQQEGQLISDSLLSEGSPENWNGNNVIRIGLLSENKINETKLESFYNLANSSYSKTKSLFNVRHDYYVNFSKPLNVGGSTIDGIGSLDPAAENLVKIARITSYNSEPITLSIYVGD